MDELQSYPDINKQEIGKLSLEEHYGIEPTIISFLKEKCCSNHMLLLVEKH